MSEISFVTFFRNIRLRQWLICLLFLLPKVGFSLTPDKIIIDYDKRKIGIETTIRLTVLNKNPIHDTIFRFEILPQVADIDEFQIPQNNPVPIFLDPGVPEFFNVTFTPHIGGKRSALLMIYGPHDTLTISLLGEGVQIEPRVAFIPDHIDFGARLPNDDLDTIIAITAIGPDDASIVNFQVSNDNGIANIFDVEPVDPTMIFPRPFQVGDTLWFKATFHPQLPEGDYTGRIEMQGTLLGGAICEFTGSVALPDVKIDPGLIDFGIVPLGSTIDTIITIINTKKITANLESFTAPNSPFTVLNPPAIPYRLGGGDTLTLAVRVIASSIGPAISNVKVTEQTPGLSGNDRASLLQVNVFPRVLESQPPSTLTVACGIDSFYTTTYILKDTGAFDITVDNLFSRDSLVSFDAIALPFILTSGASRSIPFTYRSNRGIQHDTTIIIEVFAYDKVIILDTVDIRIAPVLSPITWSSHTVNDVRRGELLVKLDPAISNYPITTLTLLLNITSADGGVDIDISTIKASFPSATVTATPVGIGMYEFSITSPIPINTFLDSLLTIGLRYYITKDTSYSVTIEAISPENEGCLNFLQTSITGIIPTECGDKTLRESLQGKTIFSNIAITPNPSTGGGVDLFYTSNTSSKIKWEILSLQGVLLGQSEYFESSAGDHYVPLDVSSVPNGTSLVRLTSILDNGFAKSAIAKLIIHR